MKTARLAIAVSLIPLIACGESTVITGPRAEVAFEQAQADLTDEVAARWSRLAAADSRPLIFLDAEPLERDAVTVLRAISPSEISRIEVNKGCSGAGFFGDSGRNGAILIYTTSYEGEPLELEFDQERVWECMDRQPSTRPGWLVEAQRRHSRR